MCTAPQETAARADSADAAALTQFGSLLASYLDSLLKKLRKE
jgi:hypothetical protein